jgi:urease accessory protein
MVGRTIADGDVLAETDDKRYFARIAAAQLIEIPVSSMKEMGRLCFELGNRHLSLKVEEDRVLVPYDHPTMEYTKKIGYEPHLSEGQFDGFLIVKAHAGTGTLIPGTSKTTGDVAEEEQEAQADEAFRESRNGKVQTGDAQANQADQARTDEYAHAHHHHDHGPDVHSHADETGHAAYTLAPGEYELNGVLHRPDGSHSHDGGATWHTH